MTETDSGVFGWDDLEGTDFVLLFWDTCVIRVGLFVYLVQCYCGSIALGNHLKWKNHICRERQSLVYGYVWGHDFCCMLKTWFIDMSLCVGLFIVCLLHVWVYIPTEMFEKKNKNKQTKKKKKQYDSHIVIALCWYTNFCFEQFLVFLWQK